MLCAFSMSLPRAILLTTLLFLCLLSPHYSTLHRHLIQRSAHHALPHQLTIIIKNYNCDNNTRDVTLALLASARSLHPTISILIANDGPIPLSPITPDPHTTIISLPFDVGISAGRNALVAAARTPYVLLLDDDHILQSTTDLARLVRILQASTFDIIGLRVCHQPDVYTFAKLGIKTPVYVANITSFKKRKLTVCTWNENDGPEIPPDLDVPLVVNVVHNAFIARVDALKSAPWRERIKLHEHMSFFLDFYLKGLRVGYLPSVIVEHQARSPGSRCYAKVRSRALSFSKYFKYDEPKIQDVECGRAWLNGSVNI